MSPSDSGLSGSDIDHLLAHRQDHRMNVLSGRSPCSEPAAELEQPVATFGDLVYVGEVTPKGAPAPAFRYERRVVGTAEGTCISTHVTWLVDSTSAPIVLQRVEHTADYRLLRATEIHRQLGSVGRATQDGDGSLELRVEHRGAVRERVERPATPIVTGPTLFGWVRRHLCELRAGRALPVRFLAADRGRTYAFTLRLGSAAAGQTTIVMRVDSLVARLAIRPMTICFDDATDDVLSYDGRIPPRSPSRGTLDAAVHYTRFGSFR
jgi:hypothetical protein